MVEAWLVAVIGVVLAITILVIAYRSIFVSTQQAQQHTFLSHFDNFYSNVENSCAQEIDNSAFFSLNVPEYVRVIYSTDDAENAIPAVTSLIKNKEEGKGQYLCFQFKDEQHVRCQKSSCNIFIPYLGALEAYNDLQLMASKILGMSLSKSYHLLITKTENGVEISVFLCKTKWDRCRSTNECCSSAQFCWSDTSYFKCNTKCADNGVKAADKFSCCSGFLNKSTGKCDEIPLSITTTNV